MLALFGLVVAANSKQCNSDMNRSITTLSLLLGLTSLSTGSTVQFTLSGTITSINYTGIAQPPSVAPGTRWELVSYYQHPVYPTQHFSNDYNYSVLLGTTSLKIGSLTWDGTGLDVQAWSGPGLPNQYFYFDAGLNVSTDPRFSNASASMYFSGPSGVVMLHDLTTLPASLSDWEPLLAETFQIYVSSQGKSWAFIGDNIDFADIRIIPEPASPLLATVAGFALLGRRRRIQP